MIASLAWNLNAWISITLSRGKSLLAFAGWISGHQADVIAYLVEDRVLKAQMRGRALRW